MGDEDLKVFKKTHLKQNFSIEVPLPVDKVNIVEDRIPYRNIRLNDPYIDGRSGDDRREVQDLDYFLNSGIEKRSGKERRRQGERRTEWVRITKWSSVFVGNRNSKYPIEFSKSASLATKQSRF